MARRTLLAVLISLPFVPGGVTVDVPAWVPVMLGGGAVRYDRIHERRILRNWLDVVTLFAHWSLNRGD